MSKLNEHEFGQTPGDGEEQGSLARVQSTGSQSPHHLVTGQLQVTKESISPVSPLIYLHALFCGFHEESGFITDNFFHLEKHTMP